MTKISAPTPAPAQKPMKLFPTWRLPNGIINASDSELEKSIESCERWEWFGGGLVVVGVIAEVAIAIMHPPYDSFWEQWGSSVATSLVAIGVALEIKFGQMAGLRQSELKRHSDEKVAEANARSVEALARLKEAELAITRIGPRQIDISKLAEELTDRPKLPVEIVFLRNDWDAYTLAAQIRSGLIAAGWEVFQPLAKSPEELARCVETLSEMPNAPLPRVVSVTTRVETWDERAAFAVATSGMPAASHHSINILLGAIAGSLKERGWTTAAFGLPPTRFDAPPKGVLRVVIGP